MLHFSCPPPLCALEECPWTAQPVVPEYTHVFATFVQPQSLYLLFTGSRLLHSPAFLPRVTAATHVSHSSVDHCPSFCALFAGSRLVNGSATFACVPSESVISYHTWPTGDKPKIVAVAALLQSNQSAIVTLQSSSIDRPAKLDGKTYASYAAR
jgi:hypothetical protein